jgi:hypothetical protein
MALYKYQQFLSPSTHAAFDEIHAPGKLAPHSGIYRCSVCGHEAVSTSGNPLPPHGSHVHQPGQGHISWRLIVTPA